MSKRTESPVHMLRDADTYGSELKAFCGTENPIFFACGEPGCEQHAHNVTCHGCLARPKSWDYMVSRIRKQEIARMWPEGSL